jgi:type IV pilus assembly protein PilN
MYSLDINFLRDRGVQADPVKRSKPAPKGSMTPLYIGLAVGLLLPALVGGMWFFLQQQIAQKESDKANLDAQLAQLKIEQNKVDKLNAETALVTEETNSLAGVFDQIKPWSAMLQDIRERIPPGVQISSIVQTAAVATAAPPKPVAKARATAAPTPAASPTASPGAKGSPATPVATAPRPTTKLEITGRARSFDDVNYFLLTLQRSSFLKRDETQIVKAELVRDSSRVEVRRPTNAPGQPTNNTTYELPKSVQYTIQTNLSDIPASELLRELNRKGAVGLVTRIQNLQEKGVIQQ